MTTDGAFIRAEKYHRIDRIERPVLPFPLKILSLKPSNRVRPSPPRVPSALALDDLDASFINAFLTDPERQENFSRACWITVQRAGMLPRLGHILADLAQHTAAAAERVVGAVMQDAFARQMLRQRRPLALEASPRIFLGCRCGGGQLRLRVGLRESPRADAPAVRGWHRARRMASPAARGRKGACWDGARRASGAGERRARLSAGSNLSGEVVDSDHVAQAMSHRLG